MDDGEITGIIWDDGCGECANSACVANTTCGIRYDDGLIDNDCVDRCDIVVMKPHLQV